MSLLSCLAGMVWMAGAASQSSEGPNPGQRELIRRGYGMFIHFGINTFNEIEWSDGKLPVSSYNPTALDCDQWIKTAKEAGFRHVILTSKHHDGFCLWDSAATDYDVGASPVKTDVIAEVAKACKKYGVKLGFYYSLWDRHEPTHEDADPEPYVEFMKKQITELLTNYGEICEFWFDGAWAKPDAQWRIPELYAHIKRIQPKCQVTVNHTISIPGQPTGIREPEDMIIGDRIRFWPVDFRTKDPNLVRKDDPKLYSNPNRDLRYLPFEHTICISSRWNWFQKREEIPARSPDELEELFYWCTANDNVLLVNLPPDQTGRIRENERKAIFETADRLGIRDGKPLPRGYVDQAFGAKAEADSVFDANYGPEKAVDGSLERSRWASKDNVASITLIPKKPFRFDRVVLHEYAEVRLLGDGFTQAHTFRVQEFTLDAFEKGTWRTVHTGKEIGAAKIIRLNPLQTAERLRVRITKASAPPSLHRIAVSDMRSRKKR
jgi:alpha-L-fucosidase